MIGREVEPIGRNKKNNHSHHHILSHGVYKGEANTNPHTTPPLPTMVVVTQTATLFSLRTQTSPPPPLLYLRHLYKIPTKPSTGKHRSPNGAVLSVRAYMEDSNTLSGFANKVIGSLPVVGLIARILSDEGGLGGDTIDFAEFRRRVGNKCSVNDSRAFIEFKDRRGRVIIYLSCWIAWFNLSASDITTVFKFWVNEKFIQESSIS